MAINDFGRCLSPTVLNCLYLLSSSDEGISKSKMTRGNLRLNLSIVSFGTTIQEHAAFYLSSKATGSCIYIKKKKKK